MKTTGSVQEKNGRFYFVVNLYDANGKRKIKWISTGLTVRGNKHKTIPHFWKKAIHQTY